MLNLLFPKVCSSCSQVLLKTENTICSICIHRLPLVCHHRTGNEAMRSLFYGKFPVEKATAIIQFQKRGITQELMHNLKYRGQKQISAFFGKWLGAELSEIPAYQSIDMVIPVPLHKQKLKKELYQNFI